MRKIKVFTVDVFTDELFKGNPAGVVINGAILNEVEMQKIAQEINLSETAFLSHINDNEFKIRYYTPKQEIDFCGHATLGASWVLGKNYGYNHEIILHTNIGIVKVNWMNDYVFMEQVTPKVKDYNEDYEEILSYLNLKLEHLDNRYQIKYAYTGNWHILIPIKSREIIDKVVVDYDKLAKHNQDRGVSTTHLYTFDTNDDILLYTRDFAPGVGIDEDPVTGSANGALSGYLVLENIIPSNCEFIIEQGNSSNRYGKLYIKTEISSGLVRIKVGGKAVIVLDGEIILI